MSKIIINGKSDGTLKAYKGDDGIAAMCAGDSLAYRKMETGTQPEPPAGPDYLCFTAQEAGSTISMYTKSYKNGTGYNPTIYISTDKENWSLWNFSSVRLGNVGDKLYMYGDNYTTGVSTTHYCHFNMTGLISASGDITTLLDHDGGIASLYGGQYDSRVYAFYGLFDGCQALTAAPLTLPSTTLADSCYGAMFYNCTNLTVAPSLPATTLAERCYRRMFGYCTSLVHAPALPTTTLASNCYASMFYNCTSLTTPPILSATTLEDGCYQNMFEGCTALIAAPELPATSVPALGYSQMFRGCTSLNSVTCLAESISIDYATGAWLSNVSANGTFTKSANMNNWPTGASGIPEGWTVVNA